MAQLKYWNGSAWVLATLKYWDGSVWQTVSNGKNFDRQAFSGPARTSPNYYASYAQNVTTSFTPAFFVVSVSGTANLSPSATNFGPMTLSYTADTATYIGNETAQTTTVNGFGVLISISITNITSTGYTITISHSDPNGTGSGFYGFSALSFTTIAIG